MIGFRDGQQVALCDWCYRVLTPDDPGYIGSRTVTGGIRQDNTTKPGRSVPAPTGVPVHACREHAEALGGGQPREHPIHTEPQENL